MVIENKDALEIIPQHDSPQTLYYCDPPYQVGTRNVENVRGAQPWVGRSAWNYGSYHLWGDVPALMPIVLNRRMKYQGSAKERLWKDREIPRLNQGHAPLSEQGTKVGGQNWSRFKETGEVSPHWRMEATKGKGSWFGDYQAQKKEQDEAGLKQGGDWFGKGEACSMSRRFSSRSKARARASAEIAKIPFPLASYIAKHFKQCYNLSHASNNN